MLRIRTAAKTTAMVIALIAALLAASTVTNAILTSAERSPQLYGERLDIGTGSLNVYEHGATGPTIVLLGGYGTASPALDYAPLIRELDGYRVVVIEGFGYGYSDANVPARTVENITAELHTALRQLNVDEPYVLAGHSLAGLYMLYYANHYRDELAAIVGIDASVPGQVNGLAGGVPLLEQFADATGLLRIANAILPTFSEPEGDAFTATEKREIVSMTNWNSGNPALVDEARRAARTFCVVATMNFPRDLPVLSFIKRTGSQPYWKELHLAQLANLDQGELIELDGGHSLHWTHSKTMAEDIKRFLDGNVVVR